MAKMILPDNSKQNKKRMVAATGGQEAPESINNQIIKSGLSGSSLASVPITKAAQFTGSGANAVMTQPMFFSPLHTPQNWQIASKRREIYQWILLSNNDLCKFDYTFIKVNELLFDPKEIIEDTLTNGILYEGIDSEKILGSTGEFRRPSRFAERDCEEKRCFSLSAYGYWRNLEVSEEHPIIVLDGKLYRHKKKIESNAKYRQIKGIVSNGVKKVHIPDTLICRKEAQDVSRKDYLLTPIPQLGKVSLESDLAWSVGLCIADGTISTKKNIVAFTHERDESYQEELELVLSHFNGTVGSRQHGDGNGWRTIVSRKVSCDFYDSYITGKHCEKKFRVDVFDLDKESRLHILGGYFDGDGSFDKTTKKLIANNYSCDMADQLYWLLLSCGIPCSLNKYPLYGEHYDTNAEWVYRIFVSSSEVPKLTPYMRSDKIPSDFIPKKNRELKFIYEEEGVSYLATPIKEIKEFVYTGKGYDLQVDPERAFVASGYVSSNCRFYYFNEPKVAAGVDFYCFTSDNYVLMSDGTEKLIKDIQEGDIVVSGDGSFRTVLKTHRRYTEEKILKIRVGGFNREIKVTLGHEIPRVPQEEWIKSQLTTPSMRRKKERINEYGEVALKSIYKDANSLEIGDRLFTPLTNFGRGYKDISDDLCYVLGAFAAEGSYYWHKNKEKEKKPKGIRFSIHENEIDTFGNKIINILEKQYDKEVKIYYQNNEKCIDLVLFDVKLSQYFYNIIGKGSKTKRISEDFINKTNKNQLLSFMSGYIDGDGCFDSHHGCQIRTASDNLFSQVSFILEKLGLSFSVFKEEPKIRKLPNDCYSYNVRVSRRDCDIFKNYSVKYKELKSEHVKYREFIGIEDKIYRAATSIVEDFYQGDVYDLTIEGEHSYVVNRVAVHNSNFSMNGFTLQCKNKKVLKYYEKISKKLNLAEKLNSISHEYFLLGDVFPFLEIECPKCLGRGSTAGGEPCNHADGSFKSIKIMNPDFIEVRSNPLASAPEFYLIPDDELRTIVQRKEPRNVYKQLPDDLINLINSGRPIPLSSRSISHVKHNASDYVNYGTSMLQRLFTYLAYKTKIMTANWIVAERLILPVRVVKVGEKDRPATEEDIQDIVTQLSAVANDPNLTIVTHHAFCHDEETEVLTDTGWKKYWEVDDDETIMVFDKDTKEMYYDNFEDRFEYNYEGEMINFEGCHLDICVTPNHRMLSSPRSVNNKKSDIEDRKWDVFEAKDIKFGYRFRSSAHWEGVDRKYVSLDKYKIPINIYLKYLGYYLSEGYTQFNTNNRAYQVSVSQSEKSSCYEDVKEASIEFGKCCDYDTKVYTFKEKATTFMMNNKKIASHFKEIYGTNAFNKSVPQWIKNLPSKRLNILLKAMLNGDGSFQEYDKNTYCQMRLSSDQLVEDFAEIAFKCGYVTKVASHNIDGEKRKCLNISDGSEGRFPQVRTKHINKKYYKGLVWCFKTKTGFFVTRRNGKITIQGNSYDWIGATGKIHNITQEMEYIGKEILDGMMLNQAILNGEAASYSSAQVGVETLIRRLENWRQKLKNWVEDHIFLPMAMMQGFVDEEESDILNETSYLVPELVWNDLQLRDKTNKIQTFMQMQEKGLISIQTLLEEVDLDYDTEVQKMREEQVLASATGMMGMGGAANQGTMGMGPMGGGMGGGMPGGEMGGDMPGGDMGGGMPGGDMGGGMPGGGMGGGAPGGGMGAAAGAELPKITKRGKGGQEEEQQAPPPQMIKLTKLEQQMYKGLQELNIPYPLFGQFSVKVPGEQRPFVLDFAYPQVGVGVETDGDIWHQREDLAQRDAMRDQKLANIGWRILRFKQDAVEGQLPAVQDIIKTNILEAHKAMHKKKAEGEEEMMKYSSMQEYIEDTIDPSKIGISIKPLNGLGELWCIGEII